MHAIIGADAYILVGFWNPLIALGILLAWGWLVSTKLDKDTLFYHFPRRQWNLAHLIAGSVGFLVMMAPVPVPWWGAVGYPLGILAFLSSVLAYWWYRNKRVPEENRYYLSMAVISAAMHRRAVAKRTRQAALTITDSKGTHRVIPSREEPAYETHIAMEELITPALAARATVIEAAPAQDGQYQVSQVVDSIRYRRQILPAATVAGIIAYLKDVAGLDVSDKRRRQMGDICVTYGAESHDLRIRTARTSAGQTLIVEVDIKKQINIKPEKLGFHPRQLDLFKEHVVADRHGVVLVTAPADNGRTTTIYGLLRLHDAYTAHIRTLEIEQLLTIDGVSHVEFDPTADADFATQLRSILRRDPDIVMVSELLDARTAQEAAHPGKDGPLIYVGIRADSALEGLGKWCKAVGDQKKAAEPIKAVIAQRLLRKLCDNCKIAYQPPAEQLRKLGLSADQVKQLFKPSGKTIERNREETCSVCAGTGYRGVIGAYELMIFDDDARVPLTKGDYAGVRTHMARNKYMNLQQAALRQAIEGITSVEEVIRVTRSSSKTKKKGLVAQKAG